MKSQLLLTLLIGSLLVLCQTKVQSRRAHQSLRLRKALSKKDCQPQEVLLAIDDMLVREEELQDTELFKSTVFDSKAIYEELITQELTEIYEYYNLRGLQTDLQVDSKGSAELTLAEVYIRHLYSSFAKKSSLLAIHGEITFKSYKLYVMRQQIYSTIKMVSMVNAFDYTLRYNNLNYEMLTLSQRFFQVATEYIRLAQIDRLFGKGVLLQISEQINQLLISNALDTSAKDETIAKQLNDLQANYQARILNEVDTLQLQLAELNLVQQIQYQYDVYALSTETTFSKQGMKAIAQTLSEMIFKDIKLHYDLYKALKSSQESKFIFQTDPLALEILEVTKWGILSPKKTTANLPALKDYASYLMTLSFLTAGQDSDPFYYRENYNKFMGMTSLDNYDLAKISQEHKDNQYINGVVGLDNNDVRSIQLTLYTITDFLQRMDDVSVFPEEIAQLMGFGSKFVMDKMIFPALASLVHLQQGYDRFFAMSKNLQEITTKYGDQLADKLEYIELMNLMTKQIKNQQIITNQKFKLLKYELFQDLLQIVVEVRNFAILYQNAVLQVKPYYPNVCKKVFNEKVLLKLQDDYQDDIQRFQLRFRYLLNNYFLRQVNLVATVKGLTELMLAKGIKLFYALETVLKKLQAGEKSEERIEYLFQYKIENTAFWKQNILYKQAQTLNKVYVRFMLRRYKPYLASVQKYIGSPFADFMNSFNNGQVTKQDLFRFDNALTGNNGLEMEQVGNRVTLLGLMQKHKCALLAIYKDFQQELQVKYSLLVNTQINYQNLVSRVRQAFYLYVSDIEVVPVDITSENYYNTINQLKVMGYDEFILQSYSGKNDLLTKLMGYKQTIDAINVDQAFRLFYCQGCYNKIIHSMAVFEYSQYSYSALMEEVNKKVEEIQGQGQGEVTAEVNVITYFNAVKQTENVVYLVKYSIRVNKFSVVYSKTENKSVYLLTQEKTETEWLTSSLKTTTELNVVTVNLHCVLDRFALMMKRFSIFQQNIVLKTQNVLDQMTVKNIIDTYDSNVVHTQEHLNHVFIESFTESIHREYEQSIKAYDQWSYNYDYKYGKNVVNNINSVLNERNYNEDGYNGIKYFVFTDRKLVYQNYLQLAWTELLANQLVQEKNALFAQYLDKNYIQDCIPYHVPECLMGEKDFKTYLTTPIQDETEVKICQKTIRNVAQTLFKNPFWKVSQSNELGKVFSKVVNLLPNYVLKTLQFEGKLLFERKFSDWSEYSKYVADQGALLLANLKNGLNNMDVGLYSVNEDNTLSVKLYSVGPKYLNFNFNAFSIYNDDIRYNIVQDMLKAAFMFPYRLVNANIRDNNVDMFGKEEEFTDGMQVRINKLQNKINEAFAENDYYGVYVGQMSEAIEKNQLLRVFIEKDNNNCYSHQVAEVSASEEDQYTDIIDNEYVVTEVVYYFEQERREQYFQDMLAVNYNDPFYRVLYSLGFRYVTANEPDNEAIHGFYDFMPAYNQQTNQDLTCPSKPGFEWLEKMPAQGMKRIWVRPKQICADKTMQKEGEYYLAYCEKEVEAMDLTARQAAFVKEYAAYSKQVMEVVVRQYNEQTFIDLTWGGMFRSLKDLLVQAKLYASMQLYNGNNLLIDDYTGALQKEEPYTTGRGQMVLLTHFFRFTKRAIQKQLTYFSNKPLEKAGFSEQGSLLNQVGGARALDMYQFNEEVVIAEVNKEKQCKKAENPVPGCLGMDSPTFAGFAADMDKYWKEKQITVYGICDSPKTAFLNYALYRFSAKMWFFKVNTCNRGCKDKEHKEHKEDDDEQKDQKKKESRLQKVAEKRRSMLEALSNGKYRKGQQSRKEQQKRLLKKNKHSETLEHLH